MKKILTFIILGILVIATAIGAYLYNQNEIEIPDETVITAIKAQFPLEVKESVLSIGTIKLSHPNIRIENNEIIIETAYEFTNAEHTEHIQAQATFSSDVDDHNGKLYLRRFDLKQLRKDGQNIEADKYALTMIGSLGFELREKKPLLYLGHIVNPESIYDVNVKNSKVVIEKKRMKLW